jgi:hypothetical protein
LRGSSSCAESTGIGADVQSFVAGPVERLAAGVAAPPVGTGGRHPVGDAFVTLQ